jgi:hypothetical protein
VIVPQPRSRATATPGLTDLSYARETLSRAWRLGLDAHGRLRALAGGHVRFGGLYDLLGVSRDYDSDHSIVRFAVVRREPIGRVVRA